MGITPESTRKPLKVYVTKDGKYDVILLSTSVMKRWGILPEEFPKVNTDKFANSSEDVDMDDTNEKVANTIRRLEVLKQKEKEEEESKERKKRRRKREGRAREKEQGEIQLWK